MKNKSLSHIARLRVVTAVAVCALALSGCSNVKKQLGYDRNSPDEFTVVKRAPLSMPPEYNLRPPAPGEERPQETKTTEQARVAVFGKNDEPQPVGSGEEALLKRAGADNADPTIRKVIDRESGYVPFEKQSVAEKVIFWKKPKPKPSVVDPLEERKRLQKNQEEGRPVNEGEVPVIKRNNSTLDKLF